MNIRYLIFFIGCFLLGSVIVQAQSNQLQHFTGKNGLAQSQVYCLLEDQRGYLWMGTQGGGLNRFDGRAFTNWRTKDGLINNFVDALFEDTKGLLWVGTKNGLSSFDGNQFKNYSPNADKDFAITSILQKDKTTLWIGTTNGLYTFSNEIWTPINSLKTDISVNHLFQNKDGLWISTSSGLLHLVNGKVTKYATNKGIPTLKITCVNEDLNGTLWIGTVNDGVFLITDNNTVTSPPNSNLQDQHIQTIFRDQSDNMWLATQREGISIWNPIDSSFQYLNRQSGLLRNDIRSITQDSWGHIWIGSPGGLSRYSGKQFNQRMIGPNSNDNSVYALCEDYNNDIWLSASSKGIVKLQDNQLTYYGQDSGFVDLRCKALFMDREQQLWIGVESKGLAVFNGKSFQFLDVADGFKSKLVRDILQDTSGTIWVATADDGIYNIVSKDTIQLQTNMVVDSLEGKATAFNMVTDTISRKYFIVKRITDYPIRGTYVYDLLLDNKQRLWFASRDQGLGYLMGDSLAFQLKRNRGLADNHIRSLALDQEGFLWAGTANAGLLRIDLEDLSAPPKQINESDGLYSNNVYTMLFDNDNNLWVGAGKGVDHIYFNAAGELESIQHFDQSDGFSGVETCTNAALKDSQGRIWFGTVNGLMEYIPESGKEEGTPPIIHLSGIRVGYRLLKDSKYNGFATIWGGAKSGLTIPYDENQLSFEFQAVNQSKPDQILYEYWLEGWDNNWVGPYTQNAPAHYSNLSPGSYIFKVRASNADGQYSKENVRWSFVISPPFWQTKWFYLLCGLGILLFLFMIVQLWTRRIRRQAAAKTERLEMEKTMLELEQKALQLQMNPHFIFNVLNSIQSLIAQKDERTARYFLAKFSKLMRAILENSRETKIPLDQEIETLEHYLSVEKFSRDDQFEYEIYIDPKLDTESIMVAPMLLQPFLENAIIHGVGQVKEGGKINLSFIQQYGTLECIIEDNGPGIAVAKKRKSQQEHAHKSAALEVTRERLDILNPLAKGKSLEIIDRVAAGKGELGTKVVVRLLL